MPDRPAPDSAPATPSPRSHSRERTKGVAALLEALAFSNGLPAAIAIGLSLVSSELLDAPRPMISGLIAGSGAYVIYTVDRLRDTRRDRQTSPLRTRFTLRNANTLRFGLVVAGLALAAGLILSPPSVTLLCLGVGAIGLFHRRLKTTPPLKTLYVSLAWVAICVGGPALMARGGASGVGGFARALEPTLGLSAVLFATLAANLIASNHRDGEARILAGRPNVSLGLARLLAAFGIGFALLSHDAGLSALDLRPLAWIPFAEGIALVLYRPTEYYGHLAVDGALLIGATASLLQLQT